MNTSWKLWAILAAGSLAGCSSRPATVVEQPVQRVEEDTVRIEAQPEDRAVVVVKPQPKPPPAKPVPEARRVPAPPALPEPAPQPEPQMPGEVPAAEAAVAQPVATPAPKPAATPASRPVAKPPAAKKSSSKNLVVKAEVVAVSRMPEPRKVPYRDALVFTKYKVLTVENGQYREKEILVAQWAMKDKKLIPSAQKRVGQTQTLSLEPLSKHKELESIMRSDDTDAYDLEPYFAP